MKNKRTEDFSEVSTTEQEREAYYRACIAEFQQLGYQEQYLANLTDELVPVLGVNPADKNT
ncbi:MULTISPECIES: hypothetical protein [Pseudoalteromonas]|uniref:Uncharacterized protein n=1 Tax=Pseudoalteromonas carrageenovora IAM 12662 TaxID=1314868 RepID=A0A2K4XCC5_PSEVC|nr:MULTISPECIES: hypothetical protein [Pseudoalteromonas]KTF11312.1 hypothetical protein ATS74_10055 [Pseudoalteromonas sp. H103]MBE0380831.1 hypothetical protein [Pseudoalteromonas carrageenovora IAM 12662]MCQ8890654.1 hypothetical protein [Pseudoalteromonas carrageenovora]MDO6465658.1 hypothetical protein [Pseudoalteromonas carrageenovora]MDO6547991.1 hypothetical protein [Pseudoalteromonas carrageenovora]|tara:strand:+ start:397 stop:579 length:183 start_codon:yes stop_codon:yes gene_type:complete